MSLGGYGRHLEQTWRDHAHYFTMALATGSLIILLLYPPVQQYILRSSGSHVMYMIVMALLVGTFVYILERLLHDL